MQRSQYIYNPDRIVTLIRQTKNNRKIWSVEVTTNAWVENVFHSNPGYQWEVDCDLDTFLLHQNEIESDESKDREISKRNEKTWATYRAPNSIEATQSSNSNINKSAIVGGELNILTKKILEDWLDIAIEGLSEFQKKGEYPYQDLLPIIAQDREGKILMQAWGNRSAIMAGFDTGLGNYFSRSRNKFWTKGEESGHTQRIFAWTLEQKFPFGIIYHVEQKGAACHTGEYSCFFREMKIWNDPDLNPK